MPATVAKTIQALVPPRFSGAALAAGFVAIYVTLDWASYIYPLQPLAITPWNPQAGLSLALLLLRGLRYAPAVFVAAFAADVAVRGFAAPLGHMLLSSAVLAAGYGGLAALLLRGLRFNAALQNVRDLSLLSATVFAATLLFAIAYVAVYDAAGLVPEQQFHAYYQRFWIGEAIGIMVTTPLVLMLAAPQRLRIMPYPDALTVVALLAIVGSILWLVFAARPMGGASIYYLLMLPILWMAVRHGRKGATLAIVVTQLGLVASMQLFGLGHAQVLEVQFLMLALATAGLFLGIAVTERERDAARRRRIEEQLREREAELDRTLRLAAVAEMSSALAHELNQPLSAIGNYARACRLMLPDSAQRERLEETMEKVVAEVARAGAVVHRLREFYRSGGAHLERVAVADLVREGVEHSERRAARERIALHLDLPKDLPRVRVDRVQIATAIHNLVSNSIDALATVSSGPREIRIAAQTGNHASVHITVTDSGPGVEPGMARQLFRPFVTTKAQGMGLGLAMSRSIAEAHGGSLVTLPIDRGAQFRLTLPHDVEGDGRYEPD